MDVLEKTGLEIKREKGMSGPEILSHHLERGTEKKKEIPDRHKGAEIRHHRIVILQLVPVALHLETKTGTSKSCRIFTMLDKGRHARHALIGWNQTE